MSKAGKTWIAKVLMKDNTTHYVMVNNEKVKDMIIKARTALKGKEKLLKGGMLPVEMWVVKAVLKDEEYSGGKLQEVVCVEVKEKKGEDSGAVGLA